MITKDNILRHEMIGLETIIHNSTDKKKIGIKGKIIDETQKTFKIKTKNKTITIPKKDCIFQTTLPDKSKVNIDGNMIISRPEDRIQKKYKLYSTR